MSDLICPDCSADGVYLALNRPGEDDFYACRYCRFTARATDPDASDAANRERLGRLNPARVRGAP